jgi:hypothetical protein
MAYALSLSPETQRSLRTYIKNAERDIRVELANLIQVELNRFAQLPMVERQNWRPGVPLHRFLVRTSDGVGRYLQFTYTYSEDEKEILVTSFGLVPL